MISLDVVGIERLDAGTAKISLGRKSPTTIYKNMAYLYLPWEMAKGIAIGEVWKVRPQALPVAEPQQQVGSPTAHLCMEAHEGWPYCSLLKGHIGNHMAYYVPLQLLREWPQSLVGETTLEMVEKVLERGEHQ